jgi:hypothetical protein
MLVPDSGSVAYQLPNTGKGSPFATPDFTADAKVKAKVKASELRARVMKQSQELWLSGRRKEPRNPISKDRDLG